MKFLLFFLLFCSWTTQAQKILTLNPMVGHLLVDLGIPKEQIEGLELVNKDPHHHEWSTAQVKKILSAELLIAPPLELNPSLSSLLLKRSKPSLILKVPSDEKRFSHAHFWFYPEVSCLLRTQIETYLKQNPSPCPYKNMPLPQLPYDLIVISHEAMAPIFSSSKIPLLILQSAREGEQSAAKLKELSLATQKYKEGAILWIKELPYHGKIKLERYAKKQERIIEVPLSSEKELFFSLNNLLSNLTGSQK